MFEIKTLEKATCLALTALITLTFSPLSQGFCSGMI